MKIVSLESIRRAWPLVAYDATVVFVSFFAALMLRFDADVPDLYRTYFVGSILFVVLLYCLVNYLFSLYQRLWRYTSAQEIADISLSTTVSTAILILTQLLWPDHRPVPLSIVLLGGILSFGGFTAVRYRTRLLTGLMGRMQTMVGSPDRRFVLIVGAGEAGQLLAWQLKNQDVRHRYELVGFVDDDPQKIGMSVHGAKVLGNREDIPAIVAERAVDLIVIAIHAISGQVFREILTICQSTRAQIKVLPNVFDLMDGASDSLPIRDISPADLLGRQQLEIDENACRELIFDKVVLVTGAGGSIGSELCRQILRFDPRLLLMLDNNETALHNLGIDLGTGSTTRCRAIVGDVTSQWRMEGLFHRFRPQLIFHAAAYKHVPLMEECPDEALWVNVIGTRILSDLASEYGAERFVFISTDKAVNPCSVMGTTKQLGELLVASLSASAQCNTLFTAVRFGNVLGSRGSVVPTFERQIARGGPVTVTHPQAKRFFLSISEATSLVIQAASMTRGGDTFMLRMGQEIKIDDLARKMIRLRGLRIGNDIQIEYTGLRPGEKLQEELLGTGERELPTGHPLIYRVENDGCVDRAALLQEIGTFLALAQEQRNGELADKLREWASRD